MRKTFRYYSLLLIFFLTLLHPAFRFGFEKKEKILLPPYWVEIQNRGALQKWQDFSASAFTQNFVFAPLQEIRGKALIEEGAAFKAPAFPKEEEIPALNDLKTVTMENNAHQIDLKYKESLLENTAFQHQNDLKGLTHQYGVKLKKADFDHSGKLLKLKNDLLDEFHASQGLPSRPLASFQAAAHLSGFAFTGKWRDAFDPAQTSLREFQREGKTAAVRMMKKTGYHGYFEEDLFQALDLRYGDGKVSLLVFLPQPGKSLASIYENLNFQNWNRWMDNFIERQGTVHLPRFRIETLSEPCCELTVFETGEKGGKDFFRYDMTDVLGTQEQFEFNANRPFFFAVRDNETDLILLMGQFTGVSQRRKQP